MLKATAMPTNPPAALSNACYPTRSIASSLSRAARHASITNRGRRFSLKRSFDFHRALSSLFPPFARSDYSAVSSLVALAERTAIYEFGRKHDDYGCHGLTCFARGRTLPGPSGERWRQAKEKRKKHTTQRFNYWLALSA